MDEGEIKELLKKELEKLKTEKQYSPSEWKDLFQDTEPRLTAQQVDQWRKSIAPSNILDLIKQRPVAIAIPLAFLAAITALLAAGLGNQIDEKEAKSIISWLLEKLLKCKP